MELGKSRVKFSGCLCQETVSIEGQVCMPFQIANRNVQVGIRDFV